MEKIFNVDDLILKLILYKDLAKTLRDTLFIRTTDRIFVQAAKKNLTAEKLANSSYSTVEYIIDVYKDLLQNKDLLNWIITELEKKLKYKIKFDTRQIDDLARSIYTDIDRKDTLRYLMNKRNFKSIQEEIDKFSQAGNVFFNLDDIDLEIDEALDINSSPLHDISLSEGIPIIYINGNVIIGANLANRQYHYMLFKKYCETPSLHKFDIIKKTDEEWKELIKNVSREEIFDLMCEYECTTAIQPKGQKAILILVAFDNLHEAVQAFKTQISNCGKIFACNDSGTQLTRKAKFKRLMKKIG